MLITFLLGSIRGTREIQSAGVCAERIKEDTSKAAATLPPYHSYDMERECVGDDFVSSMHLHHY